MTHLRKIVAKIERSQNFPTLPQVVLKLIEACNSDDTDSAEFARIISSDSSLSSKLLSIAGSAAYANLNKDIKTIDQAVLYLGADTIKNIAVSTSVMQVFNVSKKNPGFDVNEFWLHSFMCASIARRLARTVNYPNPEEAFMAGLLHDVGTLVLHENFPEAFGGPADSTADDDEKAFQEADIAEVRQAEVGAWLIRQWNVNSLMADAVLYQDEPVDRIMESLPLVKIVFVANDLSRPETVRKRARDAYARAVLDISSGDVDDVLAGADNDVTEMANSLGISVESAADAEKGEDGRIRESHEMLVSEVRDLSLLYGTIQGLLNADSRESILETAERGLQILFNVSRVFFFLYDSEKKILTGTSLSDSRQGHLINTIAVRAETSKSLMAKSLADQAVLDTFCFFTSEKPTIADEQIVRLMGSEGMLFLPMIASKTPVGVIVAGIDENQLSRFSEAGKRLKMFSRQVAMCLYSEETRNRQASILQRERMEAFSTITRKIVHEVNNPLGIIKNYLRILGMKLPEKHPAQEELTVIGEEMERVGGLIRQLSGFSMPSVGEFDSVDVNKLFSGVFEIIKKSVLLPRGIEAVLKTDPQIPVLKTDRNGLKQVLINLVKNSAEAMKSGGRIDIETRYLVASDKILIDEKRKIPGQVEIVIRDNGPGIPGDIRARLFEPYNTSKGAGNSGLGLSIVHNIIKELGGSISCESGEGEGTLFRIVLPVSGFKDADFPGGSQW